MKVKEALALGYRGNIYLMGVESDKQARLTSEGKLGWYSKDDDDDGDDYPSFVKHVTLDQILSENWSPVVAPTINFSGATTTLSCVKLGRTKTGNLYIKDSSQKHVPESIMDSENLVVVLQLSNK